MTRNPASRCSPERYKKLVVSSALWAAAGDAVGWITELSHGSRGVQHRTGLTKVSEPVDWKRQIGGRFGTSVALSAGTYSDDTQLRLAVARAIRGNGSFDVEAFAKIEVPVWQSYSLGAGIGSKAAATNLSKRGVNWFSNFFATDRQKYVTAGGNGAAMRIQPHVWSARGDLDQMVLRVLRDSIVTHGHPHGFCGAIFHALCLWDTLGCERLPSLAAIGSYIDYIASLPDLVQGDPELMSLWIPEWERRSGTSFRDAIFVFCKDAYSDVSLIDSALTSSSASNYHRTLERLGCLSDKYRGSGFKTALAAMFLAWLFEGVGIEQAIAMSANELESDTDTIATMSAALLGALTSDKPSWPIQDFDYIATEAQRLAGIAVGDSSESFVYPDLSKWKPPTNQSDAVGRFENGFALSGLGTLKPKGEEYPTRDAIWQWFDLPFGQSILAKRRVQIRSSIDVDQLPPTQRPKPKQTPSQMQDQFEFERPNAEENALTEPMQSVKLQRRFSDLDTASDEVIASGFDEAVIGRVLVDCIVATGSIETAMSLTAIIAKAKLARLKRDRG